MSGYCCLDFFLSLGFNVQMVLIRSDYFEDSSIQRILFTYIVEATKALRTLRRIHGITQRVRT